MAEPHEPRGPSAYTLERCVAAWERAKTMLAMDPDFGDDEQAIMRAFDADPHTVHPDKLIERLVHAIAFASTRQQEAAAFEGVMAARKKRYKRRHDLMRMELFDLMQALGYKRYRALEGTVSVKAGTQSTVVTDEQAIPDEYFKTIKQLDRRKLSGDLKQGVVVSGAFLSNGTPTIAIGSVQPIAETLGESDDAEDGDSDTENSEGVET
jgi:Siphovirus Gp157